MTEWVTGIDLIQEQIRIADPDCLYLTRQEDIKLTGHAIEVQDQCGKSGEKFPAHLRVRLQDLYLPGGKGVRIDSAIYSGYTSSGIL